MKTNTKNALHKTLCVLLACVFLFAFAGCNNDPNPTESTTSSIHSPNGDYIYETPDFTTPLKAEGKSEITNISDMVSWFSAYSAPTLPVIQTLSAAKQTLYHDASFQDGDVLEENFEIFPYITISLQLADKLNDMSFTVDDVTPNADSTVYSVKSSKLPKYFNGQVLVDFNFDVTSNSVVVRSALKDDTEESETTTYEIVKLKRASGNKYTVTIDTYIFEATQNIDNAIVSQDSFTYETNGKGQILLFSRDSQTEQTRVLSTWIEDAQKGIAADLTYYVSSVSDKTVGSLKIDKYTVERKLEYKYAADTYKQENAKLSTAITQTLTHSGDAYVLSEYVTEYNDDGTESKREQHIVFDE